MKAIVHIGKPKTGSSSIQEFLQLNRLALAKRGLRYQRSVAERGSQFELPMAALLVEGQLLSREEQRLRYNARDQAEQHKNYGQVATELKKFSATFKEPTAVFSTEHAVPWLNSKDLVAQFDAMFKAAFDEVRYVVYIRRHEDLLASQYSEHIKRGGVTALDTFLDDRLAAPNPFRILERWRTTVGEDRLNVRLMDKTFLEGGDLISDFCAVCGVDRDGLSDIPNANPALSATGIEVVRALNRRIPELRPKGGINPLRRGLLTEVTDLTRGGAKLKLDAARAKRVQDTLAQSNDYLRAQFFPNREALFPAFAPAPLSNADTTQDAALDVMTQIIAKLRLGQMPRLSPLARMTAAQHDPSDPTQRRANSAANPNTTEIKGTT